MRFGPIEIRYISATRRKVFEQWADNGFIAAIKYYRELKHLKVGLQDAKQYVEDTMKMFGWERIDGRARMIKTTKL